MKPLRRIAFATAALVAATAVALVDPLSPPRPANAAIDQITGAGNTDSAVTMRWADGVTGLDNKKIVTAREPKGTSAFVDDLWNSFGDLKLTVSQTTGLTHQSVQVAWSGAAPTPTGFVKGDYLQLMQCYGDADTGPDSSACQWGGLNLASLPDADGSTKVNDGRTWSVCPAANPNTPTGCDPLEPAAPDHLMPAELNPTPGSFTVPFVPVGTTTKVYLPTSTDPDVPSLSQYFNAQSTNEIPAGVTSADGTGVEHFELQTEREASGLGCGGVNAAAGNSPRACWLVVVPRGNLHPNGRPQRQGVAEPALGASAWAQRLQVRLGFLSTGNICPLDSAQRPMVGTELMSAVITAWQPALCQNGGAVYSFAATPDATNPVQLASNLPGAAGLAFTLDPIVFADKGPPLLYAPVAVTGLSIAFRMDVVNNGIQQLREIKADPGLLAKSLTQSYRGDLPGSLTSTTTYQDPAWAKTFYPQVTLDPAWQKVNPGVVRPNIINTTAPMTTADQSAVNQSVWAWIQSDPGTRGWLAGKPDAAGMVINPNYQKLKLDKAPAATGYARADPTCTHSTRTDIPADACITAVDYIPYASSLEDAAIHVQRAVTSGTPGGWDPNAIAPDGSAGYWGKAEPSPIGQRFSWGITSAPVAARYGLPSATLCTSGGSCVVPSAPSLAAAVASAKADSTGLLHVDPATAGAGAYPLTQIVYAAVRTDQDAAALRDDAALLEYASGDGQTPGVEVGRLPPGYLPLPQSLRTKAKAVATTLRDIAAATPSNSPTATGTPVHTPSRTVTTSSPTSPSTTTGTSSPTATGTPNGGTAPVSASPTAVPTGGTVIQPPDRLASGSTPDDGLGATRWVLVAALIASAGASLGGLLLRLPGRRRRPN